MEKRIAFMLNDLLIEYEDYKEDYEEHGYSSVEMMNCLERINEYLFVLFNTDYSTIKDEKIIIATAEQYVRENLK